MNPERRLTLQALMDEWVSAKISARIPGCAALAHDCDLLRRIRGALGSILMESASSDAREGRPCPWQPPCALDILFREQARIGSFGIPKPYVLSAERKDQDLVVTMTIFGFALDWASVASHALAAALQSKLDWTGQRSDIFIPRGKIENLSVRSINGVRYARPRPQAELEFLTPLNAEGENVLERPELILSRLARRIVGLARWYDAEIEDDWEKISSAWQNAAYDVRSLRQLTLMRRSGSQDAYFMTPGIHGALLIDDFAPALWPLLAIGAEIHAGKGASAGLGKFRIG
jgi:hypothetical protein